jgi:hypothetical protein
MNSVTGSGNVAKGSNILKDVLYSKNFFKIVVNVVVS